MTNNTTDTSAHLSHSQIQPLIGTFIIIFITIPVFVNALFTAVCLKNLKKKLHNLLVLSLCFFEGFLSLSYVFFILSRMFISIDTNVHICLVGTFCILFGHFATYTVVFLICIERYLTIKSFNFGISEKLDRVKYGLIGGCLAVDALIMIVGVFIVPHNAAIKTCSVVELYGSYYTAFITVAIVPHGLLLLMIVFTTLLSTRLIWKIFFKRRQKIRPLDTKENQTIIVHTKSKEFVIEDYRSEDDICLEIYNHSPTESSVEANTMENKFNPDMTSTTVEKNSDIDVEVIELYELEENDRENNEMSTNNKKTCEIENDNPSYLQQHTKNGMEWEIRAFKTNVIITTTTLFLTSPHIVSFFYDLIADSYIKPTTRFPFAVLFIINSVINPFIYALRIPEIRYEFKRLCRTNNNQTNTSE